MLRCYDSWPFYLFPRPIQKEKGKRMCKNPGPSKIPLCGGGPGFGYPHRGFALLEFHWLIEIPNIKSQISNKFQWPKFKNPNNVLSWKVLVIEYWNLRFICNLVLGICTFRHKNPRQSHLSLTPAMRDRLGPSKIPLRVREPGFQWKNKFQVIMQVHDSVNLNSYNIPCERFNIWDRVTKTLKRRSNW